MKISIEELRILIDNLELAIEDAERHGMTEFRTESNTYFCNGEFISFGRNGYLDLSDLENQVYEFAHNRDEE